MNRLIQPTTDFRSVRDGRNAQVFYIDVDLSTARSAAAYTGLVLPISGNSFYIDANPSDGFAFVHFQDTNFDKSAPPLYVSPGAIFNIPYTQVLIENSAQPGKKIRIAYGVDVDFQPGSVSQIAVTNSGGYSSIRPEAPTGFHASNSLYVANTPIPVFLPAANTNGCILLSAQDYTYGWSVGGPNQSLICGTVAPANEIDGDLLAVGQTITVTSTNLSFLQLPGPAYIPAGKGLWFIAASASVTNSKRSARWKML